MRKELNALLSNQVYKLRPTKYPSELLNKFGASMQTTNPLENVVGNGTGSVHDYGGGASALHALKENQQQQINNKKELTKMRNKKRGNRPRKKKHKA